MSDLDLDLVSSVLISLSCMASRRPCVRMFFFFKQKTAYEMRISDWSSDVCSSDLWRIGTRGRTRSTRCAASSLIRRPPHDGQKPRALQLKAIGRASCRERVCQYV